MRGQANVGHRGRGSQHRGQDRRYNDSTGNGPIRKGTRPADNKSDKQHAQRCYCCSKTNHWARECYHRYSTCNICKRKGHLAAACRSQRTTVQHLEREPSEVENLQEEETVYDFFMVDQGADQTKSERISGGNVEIRKIDVRADPMYLNVIVNNVKLAMEIDTGSYATIISESDKNKYFPADEVKAVGNPLKAYGNVPLESVGSLENLEVQLGEQVARLQMRIMRGRGPMLIGRQWLKIFGLWPLSLEKAEINNCHKIKWVDVTKEFPVKYPKLFGPGPGLYNKGMLKLVLKDNVQPVALKARHLPFALAQKVEDEINRLVKFSRKSRENRRK